LGEYGKSAPLSSMSYPNDKFQNNPDNRLFFGHWGILCKGPQTGGLARVRNGARTR
jgi:hypothetical protein